MPRTNTNEVYERQPDGTMVVVSSSQSTVTDEQIATETAVATLKQMALKARNSGLTQAETSRAVALIARVLLGALD